MNVCLYIVIFSIYDIRIGGSAYLFEKTQLFFIWIKPAKNTSLIPVCNIHGCSVRWLRSAESLPEVNNHRTGILEAEQARLYPKHSLKRKRKATGTVCIPVVSLFLAFSVHMQSSSITYFHHWVCYDHAVYNTNAFYTISSQMVPPSGVLVVWEQPAMYISKSLSTVQLHS